jgi:aminopeptidase N
MGRTFLLVLLLSGLPALIPDSAHAEETTPPMNLLANPTFEFHAFENHRAVTLAAPVGALAAPGSATPSWSTIPRRSPTT